MAESDAQQSEAHQVEDTKEEVKAEDKTVHEVPAHKEEEEVDQPKTEETDAYQEPSTVATADNNAEGGEQQTEAEKNEK